ncbi:MAG: hypothetical protein FWD09_06350 [Lentimicrobiaceae bacterium]|nr:hypothetical protein [Lentimicrobiaceae bacterium]
MTQQEEKISDLIKIRLQKANETFAEIADHVQLGTTQEMKVVATNVSSRIPNAASKIRIIIAFKE